MKTNQEFANFANNELRAVLAPIENLRRKILRRCQAIVLIIIIGGLLTFFLFLFMGTFISFSPLILAFIISFFIYVLSIFSEHISYKLEYNRKVINEIVKFVEPSLSYNPSGGISQGEYMMSGIFTRIPDRYASQNYISGKIGETSIKFSEIHSEYKTEHRGKNGHKHEQWHTIFRGIFIIADFNKKFNDRTVVLPDFAEKYFGFLGQKLQSWNLTRDQLVKLEDPDFEKEFVIYSTDQIEARYILSPALMRRILELNMKAKKLCGKTLAISFVNSNIFIAISSPKNLFEPSLLSNNNAKLIESFSFINLSAGIVEDLDLNTRIWTKT